MVMKNSIVIREMSETEREYLINLLSNMPSDFKRVREGVENVIVMWAASLLFVVVIWLALSWLIKILTSVDIGLSSQLAIWVVGIGGVICGVFAIGSSIKWIRGWRDYRPELKADIANSVVETENINIKEVKRFQEHEHCGLIYFLRTDSDKVYVLYDHESVDLYMDDKDPLSSSFKPRETLHIVRAPNSRFTINQKFEGREVPLPEPLVLSAPPENWPEQDSWTDIPWQELENRLS